MSSFLPSESQKKKSHPLASFLSDSDFQLAEKERQNVLSREESFTDEIKKRTKHNKDLMKNMVPVGRDREGKAIEERKRRLEEDAYKRYERSLDGTQVKTRDEIKWQMRRTKRNRDLDVKSLRWQEENRKRQLLELAENDITRDVNIPTGVEVDDDDYQTSTADLAQKDMIDLADMNTQAKVFNLTLPYSASGYRLLYTTSGRCMLITSTSGYIASVQWKNFKLMHENHVQERIEQAAWMMDDTMYALSSTSIPSVYNDHGEMIHHLREFHGCTFVQYLPYHFAVVGGHPKGHILYKDISIGDEAKKIAAKPITAMCQNPYNGVIVCGHPDGQVSMVTPRDKDMEPVVSMLCHKSPIQRVAVDLTGTFMVTASREGVVKVWEIKRSYKQVGKYTAPAGASALAISQRGMVAIGIRNQVLIWRHATEVSKKKIYLKHKLEGKNLVSDLRFCPYEDILGIGRSNGVSHILVPGSGMSEFDTRTANPYSTDKTTKNLNVDMLLEKVPLEMISLDPDAVGTSGLKEKENSFDNHVKISDDLKKELDNLGVEEPKENKQISKMDRTELREMMEKRDKEFKSGLHEWYEDEAPNPLNRFASKGKRKRQIMEKQQVKEEEDDEPEAKKPRLEEDGEDANFLLKDSDSEDENVIKVGQLSEKLPEEGSDASENESDSEEDEEKSDSKEQGPSSNSSRSDEASDSSGDDEGVNQQNRLMAFSLAE